MKYETKKTIAFFAICFLILSTLFIRLNIDIEKKETQTTSPYHHTQYTVKDFNGRIAVFENNNTYPQSIYDSYTSVLPEDDQKRLREGIVVSNTTDLQRIIEDYTS
ncbi:MAG: hypothetical protein IKV25_04905 [Clostridia bacterium]|nr:hypothetical protein [Clostridia bacterium]